MFCNNCGKEIDDRAAICVHCGVPTSNKVVTAGAQDNTYRPILGFILSFFFALIGAIISCVEYKKAKEVGGDHRFALAGIIIGFVSTGIVFFSIVIVACAAASALSTLSIGLII